MKIEKGTAVQPDTNLPIQAHGLQDQIKKEMKQLLLTTTLVISLLSGAFFTTSGMHPFVSTRSEVIPTGKENTTETGATDALRIDQSDYHADPAPKIEFDKMEHDFGTLKFKGEPKTVEFTFKNTGNAPLVITRTEASCTCLSVKYPRQPVMPGASGIVAVTYSPTKETGVFNNNVKIHSNSAEGRPAIVFVRGDVVK